MKTAAYAALFALIQLVNLPLMALGWLICLSPALAHDTWLWWNSDDQKLIDAMSWWNAYVYLAWRNPVANLRRIPGVSGKGRPLWYWSNQKFYAKAGWMSDGYPACSAGAGRGY
jgi:hypothetical protein